MKSKLGEPLKEIIRISFKSDLYDSLTHSCDDQLGRSKTEKTDSYWYEKTAPIYSIRFVLLDDLKGKL